MSINDVADLVIELMKSQEGDWKPAKLSTPLPHSLYRGRVHVTSNGVIYFDTGPSTHYYRIRPGLFRRRKLRECYDRIHLRRATLDLLKKQEQQA